MTGLADDTINDVGRWSNGLTEVEVRSIMSSMHASIGVRAHASNRVWSCTAFLAQGSTLLLQHLEVAHDVASLFLFVAVLMAK